MGKVTAWNVLGVLDQKQHSNRIWKNSNFPGWDIFSFSPLFGEDSHFDLIFVKWVETTNQFWLNHQITLIPSPNHSTNQHLAHPRPDWWPWFLRMSKLSSSSLATPLQAAHERHGLKRLRWNRLNMKKIRRHIILTPEIEQKYQQLSFLKGVSYLFQANYFG